MPQVLGVMVAARPGLSHSLQVDGEEELIFRVRSWFSSGQASLSPGTRTRGESDAGYSIQCAISAMSL